MRKTILILLSTFAVLSACGDEAPSTSPNPDPGTGTGDDAGVVADPDGGVIIDPDGGLIADDDAGVIDPGTCGPTNCPDGCCVAGVCKNGNENSACGDEGLACNVCPGWQICSPVTKACIIDADQVWKVQIKSLVIKQHKPGTTDSWDLGGGMPDPYVEFNWHLGPWNPDIRATSVKNDFLNATWNPPEGIEAPATILMNGEITVGVYDNEVMNPTDEIAKPRPIQLTAEHFAAGRMEIQYWGGIEKAEFVIIKK